MTGIRSYIAVLCALLLIAPAGSFAADPPQQQATAGNSIFDRLTGPYRASEAPPIHLANSPRLESLLRAGNLYLSLQDAIALALENNLDIAIQRYGPQLADAALRQAEAGGFARGVSTSVTAGPSSASVTSAGTTPGANVSATALASNASSSAVGASVISAGGPSIPVLDPTLTGTLSWGHQTTPQSSAFLTRHEFADPAAEPGQFRYPEGLPHRHHGQPWVEQQLDDQQQPAQRFQPLHQFLAGAYPSASTCCRATAGRSTGGRSGLPETTARSAT